jgi:hypothetical protein
MNMRARFGVAVFAGLVLGIAIVAAASLTSYGSFGASALTYLSPSRSPATTSTITATTTAATTSTMTVTSTLLTPSITSQTQQSSNSSNLAASVASTGGTPRSSFSPSASPAAVSRLVTIAHQPLQSIVVLLPILAAVFFGFILYRASRVRPDEEKSTS